MSDARYLQPSGQREGGPLASLAVFPPTVIHLDPCVQLNAHACARTGVIFRKDSDVYATLALSTLCVFYMGPRWSFNVRKLSKKHTDSRMVLLF